MTDRTPSESVQVIRMRPGMYLGDTDHHLVQSMVRELVANAIDQFLVGEVSTIGVFVSGNRVTVEDDGPGFPIEEGAAAAEALTRLHTTNSLDGHAPHAHLLTSGGVGLVAVNAASASLVVQAWRNGVRWERRFERGVPTRPAEIVERGQRRGTTLTFEADEDLFGDVAPRTSQIRADLLMAAHLFGGLKLQFQHERFQANGGLADFAPLLNPEGAVWPYRDEPAFHISTRRKDVAVEVYVAGRSQQRGAIRGWANGAQTLSGSHIRGLKDALKSVGWRPAIALIHVIMHEPEYAGPTREELKVPKIRRLVRDVVLGAIR